MSISVKKVKMTITALAIPIIAVLVLIQGASQASGTTADETTTLFNSKCAICHGADGSGNTMNGKKLNVRDLRCPEVQKMTDSQLGQIISKGKNKMPAYEATLGNENVNKLVGYTRELAKKK